MIRLYHNTLNVDFLLLQRDETIYSDADSFGINDSFREAAFTCLVKHSIAMFNPNSNIQWNGNLNFCSKKGIEYNEYINDA